MSLLRLAAFDYTRGQFEHGSEQTDLRIANRELRRMHTDGQAASTRREVITEQRALTAFVQLAMRIKRKRARGNHEPFTQTTSHLINSYHPALRNELACRGCVRLALPTA